MDNSINDSQIFNKNDFLQKQEIYTSLSSANIGGSVNYGGNSTSYNNSNSSVGARQAPIEFSKEDMAKFKETRKMEIDNNPFYIKPSSNVKVITFLSNKKFLFLIYSFI